jgi:hypothetical protein
MPQQVWQFLSVQKNGKWWSVRDLMALLEMPEGTVRDQTRKLLRAQKIRSWFDGKVFRFQRRA